MVFRHRNADPKMGPFSEPSVIVPILEGSRNGPGFRAHFWSRFSPFLNAGFRKKMVASRCCCDDHNLSQFLSCFRSQHDSLSCCRIRVWRQRQQQGCAAMQLIKRSKIIGTGEATPADPKPSQFFGPNQGTRSSLMKTTSARQKALAKLKRADRNVLDA